jgi:hypothetical protein
MSVSEDDQSGESGAVEDDPAAGEVGAVEVTAVEDHAREVEVQALPGLRLGHVGSEVRGDDPDHGVADLPAGPEGKPLASGGILPLPAGPEGKPLASGGILSRIRLVRHAQITAQHINAGLPVLRPVIRQARQRIYPGQPDFRRLITAQLPGCRGEPFVEGPVPLLSKRLVQLLALLFERLLGVPAGCTASKDLRN